MHWIIQDNLYREDGVLRLFETLERLEIPHTVVKVVPFTADLSDAEQIVPPIEMPTGHIMVCGSTTLAKIAQHRGWMPGSFLNANHDYRVWRAHYGDDLLNADAVVCRFDQVEPRWTTMFIRPCEDSKTFSGMITDWLEFAEWRDKVIRLKETYTSLDAATMVMYGPLKSIRKEFRFFIVDGEIAGESVYKIGNRVAYQSLVDDGAIAFTRRMIAHWQPARAFVIDVAALDDDRYAVVEINCINSAGFYSIDIAKFVMAIENMKF